MRLKAFTKTKYLLLIFSVVTIFSLALWISFIAVPLPERLSAHSSAVMHFADGSPAHVFLSADDKWRIAVPLKDVDHAYINSLIRFEDKRFYYHPGVDPLAIIRAIFVNMTNGRVVSGGSTITMQLVRILEQRPRTMRSKIIEAWKALQLEYHLSKDQILENYLQFIPFGGNLEGIEAASLSFFSHRSKSLSPNEIAILLAIPQKPTNRIPSLRNKKNLVAARNEIAKQLINWQLFTNTESDEQKNKLLAQIDKDDVPLLARAMPRHAPHMAWWLNGKNSTASHYHTTLDQGIQALTERIVASYRREMLNKGIHNIAVVIADHTTGEIKSLVGNYAFTNDNFGAMIPSFSVLRSTGSTLKPFIYAIGIDRGLALPDQMVLDIPRNYSGYVARNYDDSFSGMVRLDAALSRSLNIPFIDLLSAIRPNPFIDSLRDMGANSLSREPGYYGLSAAVGGVEISPLEMTSLYVSLANGGVSKKLKFVSYSDQLYSNKHKTNSRRNLKLHSGMRVFSEGAAWLTRVALSKKDRPDFPSRRQISGAPSHIHWKTGTSYGHRDAWSVGSGPRHTVVVWQGNLDNSPSFELVGAEASGPILFDLLDALSSPEFKDWLDKRPSDLSALTVCSLSGLPPSKACPNTHQTFAPKTTITTKKCPVHKFIDVDDETGKALYPGCRKGRKYHQERFAFLPPKLRRYLTDMQFNLPAPPETAKECHPPADKRPVILSPPRKMTVLLIPGVPLEEQEIPLEADSSTGSRISWFVDGNYLGSVKVEERFWWLPSIGTHEFIAMDEAGRTAKRVLQVNRSPM